MTSANLLKVSQKNKTKSIQEKKLYLKKKKVLEEKLDCNEVKDEYNICKENINATSDEIANEIIKPHFLFYKKFFEERLQNDS